MATLTEFKKKYEDCPTVMEMYYNNRAKRRAVAALIEAYQEVYRLATPGMDFVKEFEAGNLEEEFFMKHYLDKETQDAVVEKWKKAYKCNRMEKDTVDFEFYLGASPTSVKYEI